MPPLPWGLSWCPNWWYFVLHLHSHAVIQTWHQWLASSSLVLWVLWGQWPRISHIFIPCPGTERKSWHVLGISVGMNCPTDKQKRCNTSFEKIMAKCPYVIVSVSSLEIIMCYLAIEQLSMTQRRRRCLTESLTFDIKHLVCVVCMSE